MRRKIIRKQEVNGDRWIVSYADLLTLLFCFFVVMYSISSLDSSKYALLSNTLEQQLSDERDKNSELASDLVSEPQETLTEDQLYAQNLLAKAEREIDQIASDVEEEFQKLITEERVKVKRNKFWLEVEFNSNLLYPSGSSQLLNEARPLLVSLAQRLAPMSNRLNIEGFTDNRPISNDVFPSNWELSAARAATVVRLFEANGVQPVRMASIGYGEHQPIADNNTDEGRALNRRVVVVVMAAVDEDDERKEEAGNNKPRLYQLDQLEEPFALKPLATEEPSASIKAPSNPTENPLSNINFEFQYQDTKGVQPLTQVFSHSYEYSF